MGAPREWAPCSQIWAAVSETASWWGLPLAKTPRLTSVAAEPLHLAFGTECGHLLWYHRDTARLQRLRIENSHSPVTCVKIASTVDHMVAAGDKTGQVTIFQIPKPHPDSVPDYIKPKTTQQIERYTISDLHKTEITALEWSKNGMKLFSGDKNGIVVLTEIDFYMHICKSIEIINESYEIIQLSYCQNYLLISSVFRSILCHKDNLKWNVDQVGKKDRKNLCKLGGTFCFNYEKPNDVRIYSARPGMRIWTSDFQGNVLETLLFKDAIANPINRVELLNPATKKKNSSMKDLNFGPMLEFNDNYLVSYNDELLYILDPETLVSIATIDEFRRIISVAVNKKEIFVLEGDSSIVRLAYAPDIEIINTDENRMTKSLINPIQFAFSTIKDIANSETKLFFSDATEECDTLINTMEDSTIPTFTDTTSVVKAEECFELPPVKNLAADIDNNTIEKLMSNLCFDNEITSKNHSNVKKPNVKSLVFPPQRNTNKLQIFDSISQIEFSDDILHSSVTCKHHSKNTCENPTDSKESQVKIPKMTKPSIMSASFYHENKLLPDDRSPESIEKEIKDKEEMLAKALNLEPITICQTKTSPNNPIFLKDDLNDSNTTVKKTHKINKDDGKIQNIINDKKNITSKNSRTKIEPPIDLTPKCVSIPNLWNLQEIKIKPNVQEKNDKRVENNIVYDADWELV